MTTQQIPTETTRIATALDSLPTLPIVALQIGEVVHGKNVTVQQVAEILRSDPATSAKLLRLVNSPYFGIPGGVSDVARAIPFVGFNTLYQLVLSISVLESLGTGKFDAKALWLHSLTVATAARELATETRMPDPGACFTAGLLHDMGKIALARIDPDKLTQAFQLARSEGISIDEAEKRVGLAAHDKIGSRLAKKWKFPATLTTPIEQHHGVHRPEVSQRLVPHLRAITECVAAADQLAHECAEGFIDDSCDDGSHESSTLFERNGLSAEQRRGLIDRTRKQLEKSRVFLSLVA